ncbi:Methyltransferase type 12 [Pirellula staleyi DSM 6068]|uniref:Methyltransferase type 12 n=1 Tax=Pirellula staleyi (strain ATCC 27377 / DSM 6068 / ICPB 4128) TaxID=530564 RepID=D2QZ45_PIRSD|nr:class I SAM-dependent methyltransferase [Pirellula staleyi]ADB18237.1 Methyltransferase type 12 [Pirellula staleyi DSM 6068]
MTNDKPRNLYDYPRYYDLVFGSDWKPEFHFLHQAFAKYVRGEVKRVFEPACGTGRLLFRFARAGLDSWGLDLNPHAVDYCNRRLKNYRLPETAWVGNMADFTVKKKFDAAFNTINSFRHLLSEADALAHLQCMAESLKRGGIYVLGLHLAPLEGEPITEERWGARRGNLAINTHLATFDLDLKKRTERCTMTMLVYTPTQQFQIVDELVFRTYTAAQMRKLITAVPEFEIADVYDFSYRIKRPITIGPDTQDVVLILRKK